MDVAATPLRWVLTRPTPAAQPAAAPAGPSPSAFRPDYEPDAASSRWAKLRRQLAAAWGLGQLQRPCYWGHPQAAAAHEACPQLSLCVPAGGAHLQPTPASDAHLMLNLMQTVLCAAGQHHQRQQQSRSWTVQPMGSRLQSLGQRRLQMLPHPASPKQSQHQLQLQMHHLQLQMPWSRSDLLHAAQGLKHAACLPALQAGSNSQSMHVSHSVGQVRGLLLRRLRCLSPVQAEEDVQPDAAEAEAPPDAAAAGKQTLLSTLCADAACV